MEILFTEVLGLTLTSAAVAIALSSNETLQRIVVMRMVRIAFLGVCTIIMLLLDAAG